MITPVARTATAPVHVRPVPPAVEPVAPVAAHDARAPQSARPSAAEEARRAVRALDPPPEPLSTQSVLMLRQSGASVAGIAEAYGMSVEAIRRLLDAGREDLPPTG